MAETFTLKDSSKLLDANAVKSFLSYLAAVQGAYQRAWFHYLAIRDGSAMVILKGTIHFFHERPSVPSSVQLTANIQVGCFEIANGDHELQQFLSDIAVGVVKGPLGDLKFGWIDPMTVTYLPVIPEAQQFRWSSLTLRRSSLGFDLARKNALDWEIRAARPPYDNLDEVVSVYQCGPLLQNDMATIEVLAPNVVGIGKASTVKGGVAHVELNIVNSLDERRAALTFRVIVGGRCVERGVKESSYFSWRSNGGLKVGTIEFNVPISSLIQCFAVYEGAAQQSWFIGDLSNSQNPRRTSFEAFDPALNVLNELLSPARKSRSREFESGVAALFWLLGFGVVHLNDSRHSDAVDLVATAPDGGIALIECTTGLLKEDSKLANLVSRAYAVRQRLNASGSSHVPVLPIIITSKAVGEISHEVDAAHVQGVAVMAMEDLSEALGLTALLPDADVWFKRLADHLQQRMAQLKE